MGFFSKKPKRNKIYNLSQALQIVGEQKQNYSVKEVSGGYILVPDEEIQKEISSFKQKRGQFVETLNGKQENSNIEIRNQAINNASIQRRYAEAEKYVSQQNNIIER